LSLSRAIYRSRQVWQALWPRIDAGELALVHSVLPESARGLFLAMEKRDQRHALEVARRLRELGDEDIELLQAALLHDCGKGAVPVWLRVLKVLSPGTLRRLAVDGALGYRGAAYRLLEHGAIGARLAASAGLSLVVARLIEGRIEPGDESRAALLAAADDAS
jgi:hypothetical protein